jgi:glycosyltransferase involved in cell wall biosynthesis
MLSKHHYALELSRLGHHVWFLLPPWADSELARRYTHSGVHLVFDHYSIKGARFLPSLIRRAWYKRIIKRLEKDCGGPFTLVWSFDNSRFFDLDCFQSAFRIHHMMDFHTDYQIKSASVSADLCLGVTSGIVAKMKPYNPHSYFVQHGYAAVKPEPAKFPDTTQTIKALYTGNLLMPYVQWSWLHALVEANPEVHFFLVGSYGQGNLNEHTNTAALEEVKKIARHTHVTLLGECTPGQMQSYLQQADVLFFAYRSAEFPEILANSHKIMAYLASGKPIVSHHIAEYQGQSDLLYMCKTLEDYLHTFREVIEQPETHGAEMKKEKRQAWAENNAYLMQIHRVEKLIQAIQPTISLISSDTDAANG